MPRELIDTGNDKRFVRRDSEGQFKESDDVGRTFFIALFDTVSGRLLATFDGETITAERTAAATALAVRRMARSGSSIAALFGTGIQATWQALADSIEYKLLAKE